MLKNKKSFAVILSFVMVLALACSVWAAGQLRANGTTEVATDHIVTSANGDAGMGAWASALNGVGGHISILGYNVTTTGNAAIGLYASGATGTQTVSSITLNNGNVETSGDLGHGAYAMNYGSIDVKGNITTLGADSHGARAQNYSRVAISNSTITTSGENAYGVFVNVSSILSMTGNIITSGFNADGAYVNSADITVNGSVTTSGENAEGVFATNNGTITMNGDTTTSGKNAHGAYASNNGSLIINGDITTSGYSAHAAYAAGTSASSAEITVTGNVDVNGEKSYGLLADEGTVDMNDGAITVTDESSAGIFLCNDGVATLTNVTTDTQTLMVGTTGVLNAENSELSGDISQVGFNPDETLEINLVDSTLHGAVSTTATQGYGGTVDIALEDSDWFVTGNSNTNGTVTGDGNSAIDYSQAPDGTIVIVDEIVGELDINLKVGDQINVTNTDGNNSFSSSDPDVLGVEQNADGSWSIVSKGEGDADLTYTYKDPATGTTKEVTTGVTSVPDSTGNTGGGSGQQSYSGGSSSNCNAGMGFWAMLSLLGMAVIQKRK